MKPPKTPLSRPHARFQRTVSAAVIAVSVLAGGCGSANTTSQVTEATNSTSDTASGPTEAPAVNDGDAPTTPTSSSDQSNSESSPTTAAPATTQRPTTTTTVPVTTTLYNPSEYFEVTFDFVDYICEDHSIWGDQFDCVRYFGGRAPVIFTPDLYCSGPDYALTCSVAWYPNELDDYEFVTVNYRDYVCEDTWAGGWDDKDCYLYSGGDPSRSVSGWVDLYCSDSGYSMTCDADEYPSVLEAAAAEWDDYVILTIEWSEYICDQGAFGDMPCVRYYGGSPSGYFFWSPDYYCDRWSNSCESAW